jgi:hypothetical protein
VAKGAVVIVRGQGVDGSFVCNDGVSQYVCVCMHMLIATFRFDCSRHFLSFAVTAPAGTIVRQVGPRASTCVCVCVLARCCTAIILVVLASVMSVGATYVVLRASITGKWTMRRIIAREIVGVATRRTHDVPVCVVVCAIARAYERYRRQPALKCACARRAATLQRVPTSCRTPTAPCAHSSRGEIACVCVCVCARCH